MVTTRGVYHLPGIRYYLWLRVAVYDTIITNPEPKPIRLAPSLVGISPFVSYIFNHGIKEVVKQHKYSTVLERVKNTPTTAASLHCCWCMLLLNRAVLTAVSGYAATSAAFTAVSASPAT